MLLKIRSSRPKRAMKRPAQLCCPFQNTCVITKTNRKQCQSCRLQKCFSIALLSVCPSYAWLTSNKTVCCINIKLCVHQH
uniref:Nuclear receptor domain-containing protein n=1 Tax=Sinocyclocheilus grahami TaxID=75366 RepID=A0A672KSW3_SINGR